MKLFRSRKIENKGLNNQINLEGKKKPKFKHSPIVYKIYDFMKNNAVGYEKRMKSSELMKYFNIDDNKTFRAYVEEIRQSAVLQKIICSESGYNGGYWIATNQDEVYDTLNHLYKRAMEMLKTYAIIKNKYKLDGQYRLKMSKYEKEVFESLMKEGDK